MTTDQPAEPLEAIAVETRPTNPITTILAWIGVAVLLFIVASWVWTRWINPSAGGTIERYANGNGGVAFESPSDEFRVTMPTKYQRTTATNNLGEVVTVKSAPSPEYSFSVTKTPEPVSALESYATSLHQVAQQLADQYGARIVSESKPVPFADVAVAQVVYRKGNTYWRAAIQLLKNRVYTVVAKTPNSDPAPFKRLGSSFQILGPR